MVSRPTDQLGHKYIQHGEEEREAHDRKPRIILRCPAQFNCTRPTDWLRNEDPMALGKPYIIQQMHPH